MGVEVAEEEAEEGGFGDGVVQGGAVRGEGIDDAAAAPPPEVSIGEPCGGAGGGFQESFDAEPLPEIGGAEAAGVGEFGDAGEVAEEYHGQGGGRAAGEGGGDAGAGQAQQSVGQAGDAGGEEGRQGGQHQVVRRVGGDAGHCGQEGGDEVAAVVVGYGVSGQPVVLGGEAVGDGDGVHNAEVHRLFGMVDGRDFADHQGPEGEDGQEQELGDDQYRPAAADEVQELGALSPGEGGGSGGEEGQGGPDAGRGVGYYAGSAAEPGEPGEEQ